MLINCVLLGIVVMMLYLYIKLRLDYAAREVQFEAWANQKDVIYTTTSGQLRALQIRDMGHVETQAKMVTRLNKREHQLTKSQLYLRRALDKQHVTEDQYEEGNKGYEEDNNVQGTVIETGTAKESSGNVTPVRSEYEPQTAQTDSID